VRLIQQRVWRLRQRHKVVRPKNQEKGSDNKGAQRPRAKPELRLKGAPLLPRREASGPVNRLRKPAARRLALLASRDSSSVRQGNKLRNQECRAKVLSRGKRRGLRREQSRAGHREVNDRALQGYLLVSKKVRESSRGKRSGQG
jgi:hypothetical protein